LHVLFGGQFDGSDKIYAGRFVHELTCFVVQHANVEYHMYNSVSFSSVGYGCLSVGHCAFWVFSDMMCVFVFPRFEEDRE